MASWTNPHTATTGEVITAAQWNAEVRDNSLFLYEAFSADLFLTSMSVIGFYATGAANRAILSVLLVTRKITVTNVRFRTNTSSGNLDVGIYDASYTRLWSTGSFASSSGEITKAISAGSPTSLTLTPAKYWLAIAADNNTVTIAGASAALTGTAVLKDSAFPLPSAIASPSASGTGYLGGIFA